MKWIFTLISFWLIFVLSLAGWWLYFGITVLSGIAESESGIPLVKHQKMLFYEGCVLLFFLLAGGLALFYFSFRMYKEKSAKEKFFATFSHDIKTALFRIQLQIEDLGEQVGEEKISPILVQARKLHLDLENGLDAAIGGKKNLFIEKIDINEFLADLHTQWPEFHIQLKGEAQVLADRKALSSVFKNLLHNSFFHGKADKVVLDLRDLSGKIQINYIDNGQTFKGNLSDLGNAPLSRGGSSGYGLYLVQYWMERMRGGLDFRKSPNGQLEIEMTLPGAL